MGGLPSHPKHIHQSECYSPNSRIMFGIFKKDPVKKLQEEYRQLLEKAMHVQRSGDLKAYATMMDEAERLANRIEEMRKSA